MPTNMRHLIFVTDDKGEVLLDDDSRYEPEVGSVVLTHGTSGTAWQRWVSDGKWHSCLRPTQPKDWAWMMRQRNLVLVYETPSREERER